MANTSVSKGQIVHTSLGPVTVVGCGNGRYTIAIGNRRITMPCSELHTDIDAGRAVLADMSVYAQHETTASVRRADRNDDALLAAQVKA